MQPASGPHVSQRKQATLEERTKDVTLDVPANMQPLPPTTEALAGPAAGGKITVSQRQRPASTSQQPASTSPSSPWVGPHQACPQRACHPRGRGQGHALAAQVPTSSRLTPRATHPHVAQAATAYWPSCWGQLDLQGGRGRRRATVGAREQCSVSGGGARVYSQ